MRKCSNNMKTTHVKAAPKLRIILSWMYNIFLQETNDKIYFVSGHHYFFLSFKKFLQNKMILGIFAPKIYIYLQIVLHRSADPIGNYRLY